MPYTLGVDVGGTFTDIFLVNEADGRIFTAKVSSTPQDSSIGVLKGIEKVCETSGISPSEIGHVMHGTTVATNTVLTGTGALVGLVTTKGFRQVLQIARSYVPGGLGGWVIYNKSEPMAPLELTVEADERVAADGEIVRALDEGALRERLEFLKARRIEALTVCLINSFANGAHEQRIRDIAAEVMPDIPVSLSFDVIPEMQEYERAVTTVANSYVRPRVQAYIENLTHELSARMDDVKLHVLRSDGGLASSRSAAEYPVNLLMSGPAGGVAGAVWIAKQAGYMNLLTIDMGGTSTDVALVQNGEAQTRRETTVGDVTVRASSIDVRTVGAGGGSVAHVPELTGALRVGPQSAGAEPGPAAYGLGGEEPTVTDANMVLGYLPQSALLAGDMQLDGVAAASAVQKVADALKLPLDKAAAGIIDIVNENMFGALRLVSIEQGYDPRDFALMAFGGAGPLHANALGRLMSSWPVIIPPGPGVLCAAGDATTRVRDEASRTFIRRFGDTTAAEVMEILNALAETAATSLDAENVPRSDQSMTYQADLRYHGQGLLLTVDADIAALETRGLDAIGDQFEDTHKQLFTFALDVDKEVVNLRAVVQGKATVVNAERLAKGEADVSAAILSQQSVFMDGVDHTANIYDRSKLRPGNRIDGPAIVTEMDSTSVILAGHSGEIDDFGNIIIRPMEA
ncbi:MAG: hydantoinase/oxoprolinase family protein [Gammaproteobacteria bacterium]